MHQLADVKRILAEDLPHPADSRDGWPATPSGEGALPHLVGLWVKAHERALEIFHELEQAETDAAQLYPPRPAEAILHRHPDRQPWEPSRAWLVQHRLERAVVAYDRWQAQIAAVDAAHDVPALSGRTEVAWSAVNAIAAEILEARPTDAAEAALKFGVLLKHCGDGRGGIDDAAPVFAFLKDLEHLARAASVHQV